MSGQGVLTPEASCWVESGGGGMVVLGGSEDGGMVVSDLSGEM